MVSNVARSCAPAPALALALALALSTQACGGSGPEPERSADPLTVQDAGPDSPAAAPTPSVDPDTTEGQAGPAGGSGAAGSTPSMGSPAPSDHAPSKQ